MSILAINGHVFKMCEHNQSSFNSRMNMYRVLVLIAISLLLSSCKSLHIIASYEIFENDFEYWIEKNDGTRITEKKEVDRLLKAKGLQIRLPMTFEEPLPYTCLDSSCLDSSSRMADHITQFWCITIDMADNCQHSRDTISLIGVKVKSNCLKKNEGWCGKWEASAVNKGVDPCSSLAQSKGSKGYLINDASLPIIVPDSLLEPNRELYFHLDVFTITKASSIRKLHFYYDVKVNDITIHLYTKIRRLFLVGVTGRV